MAISLRKVLEHVGLRLVDRSLGHLRGQVPGADPYHRMFAKFRQLVMATDGPAVLELGSRGETGREGRDRFPGVEDYTGVDIHAGPGVDVVVDVHRLSARFPGKRFDFAYSISVFEHLMFPWKVVLEINSVLKTNGHVFVASHPAWPPHALPWDYWRFLHHSAHALFNQATGFELVEVSEGLPARLFSLVDDQATRGIFNSPMNQGIAMIARKTGDYDRERLRWDLVPADVTDTLYPNRPPPPAAG